MDNAKTKEILNVEQNNKLASEFANHEKFTLFFACAMVLFVLYIVFRECSALISVGTSKGAPTPAHFHPPHALLLVSSTIRK